MLALTCKSLTRCRHRRQMVVICLPCLHLYMRDQSNVDLLRGCGDACIPDYEDGCRVCLTKAHRSTVSRLRSRTLQPVIGPPGTTTDRGLPAPAFGRIPVPLTCPCADRRCGRRKLCAFRRRRHNGTFRTVRRGLPLGARSRRSRATGPARTSAPTRRTSEYAVSTVNICWPTTPTSACWRSRAVCRSR